MTDIIVKEFKCKDPRTCFGRKEGRCTILLRGYEEGKCSFCKPFRDITNGIVYKNILKN